MLQVLWLSANCSCSQLSIFLSIFNNRNLKKSKKIKELSVKAVKFKFPTYRINILGHHLNGNSQALNPTGQAHVNGKRETYSQTHVKSKTIGDQIDGHQLPCKGLYQILY